MEMSCSCSSPVPDYSEDTFTSFSEGEEEETSRPYGDDSFESYYSGEKSECPAVLDSSESTSLLSGQDSEAEHEPDVLDSVAVAECFTRKWIGLLQDTKARTEQVKPAPDPDKALIGTTELSVEELGALQSFCSIKIQQLSRLPHSVALKRNRHKNQRHGFTSKKPSTGDLSCIVPHPLVNRLCLENIKETVKQLAEAQVHQPSRCPHCLKKKEELAKASFLRRKKTLLESILLQEKLEEHMYCKDSLTLIGEIHRSLPKLLEDPKNIWQELNMRGLQI